MILDVAGSIPVGRPNRPDVMPDIVPLPDIAHCTGLVLLTCAEMGRADAAAIASGIPGSDLMEAAGKAVASAVIERYRPQPVAVLCGPGNNGGDGFVAARHLMAAGWPVRVGLLGEMKSLKGDAAWAARQWTGPMAALSPELLDGGPLVIDALFGAGLSRAITGVAATTIGRVNADRLAVVAVDVPSGLHGDTGAVMGAVLKAELTVTFFRGKPGHFSAMGLRRCGELRIADIGIPVSVLETFGARQWRNDPMLWAAHLRRDLVDDHKYARGHATILAGAAATGAARLAAVAARRAGAGLATIAAPRAALAIYQAAEPGNLIVEAEDEAAFLRLLEDPRRNAILLGPGSGVNDRTHHAVLAALATRQSVVLDADAITVFADDPQELFTAIAGPVLLTPHAGEFRRLFPDLASIDSKIDRARRAAERSGATVLLKGPDTVIAAPDGRAVINVHALPSLATAGSGDVLAGISVGLMAQGLAPLAAGAAASWLHGECAYGFGKPGLIAEDLNAHIPGALHAALIDRPAGAG